MLNLHNFLLDLCREINIRPSVKIYPDDEAILTIETTREDAILFIKYWEKEIHIYHTIMIDTPAIIFGDGCNELYKICMLRNSRADNIRFNIAWMIKDLHGKLALCCHFSYLPEKINGKFFQKIVQYMLNEGNEALKNAAE